MKAIITHRKDEKPVINIRVDPSDTWNLDFTFALLAVPLLQQLLETTHGAPDVDLEDVPVELRGYSGRVDEENDVYFQRWDWVLQEMIWGFQAIIEDDIDFIFDREYHDRIDNAMRLFGKYFRNLWD